MNSDALDLAAKLREHLFTHILPFWCGPAVDHEQGGWMGWLSNDLTPDRTKPKGLIVHSRILWTFSAVHRVRSKKLYREMAFRAYEYLVNRFWDEQHGGAFWRTDDKGRVIDDSKKIYGQAFCIYALAEFHRSFGETTALSKAQELFELIERHAHDRLNLGYVEVCQRDWSEAGPGARLSEKDLSEKKSMNNHLHLLEAYTNLYRVWRVPQVELRLRELIHLFQTRILDHLSNHLHHFFDQQWHVRSNTYTFGHDIEATWLLCEAADELGDPWLQELVHRSILPMAETVLSEGLASDGGLYYEGKAGRIIDKGRECWPQAEAMIGFVNAYQLTQDTKWLDAGCSVWSYAQKHLVDWKHGEWFWRIGEDGTVDDSLPKVSEWKGPYHVSRACIDLSGRLSGI